jgi:hypothetical protein
LLESKVEIEVSGIIKHPGYLYPEIGPQFWTTMRSVEYNLNIDYYAVKWDYTVACNGYFAPLWKKKRGGF